MAQRKTEKPNNYPWDEIQNLDPTQRTALSGHGPCFVCGDENPKGLGVQFHYQNEFILAEVTLDVGQQGAPFLAHGGALASILDEAMGVACWRKGHTVMSGRIEVDYRKPAPLGQPLEVVAWVDREDGRKVWAEGCIFDAEGTRLTESRSLFIEARKNFKKEPTRP